MNGRKARAYRRYADMLATMSEYRHLGTSSKTIARRMRKLHRRLGSRV